MELLFGASSAYHAGQYVGLAAMAALLVILVRRGMKPHRSSRARMTDAVAALVVGALLIGASSVSAEIRTPGRPIREQR
jgi:nitrate reductase gamma subunit